MDAHLAKPFCIMNPAAGTRKEVRRVVENVLQASGADFRFHETEAAGHGYKLTQDALAAEASCVIGIGGDGTLNEVARALVGGDIPFGMIPVGSGNAFARALGVSVSPHKACEQLLDAKIKCLDVGTVEEQIFLSTAGVGLDAEVAWQYGARKGKRRGLIPYVQLTLNIVRQYTPETVRLIIDDGPEMVFCPSIVVVANTAQYGNGAIIAPGASAEDGVLDVRVIEPKSLLSKAIHGRRLFDGTIDHMPGVTCFQARTVRVEREGAGHYQFDGEALEGTAQLHFGLKEKALSVMVPRGRK
mgnify:CR=1 FL=1